MHNKALIILTPKGLLFQDEEGRSQCDFASESVSHQEVKNEEAYHKLLFDFLRVKKIKNTEILIALAKELLYEKALPLKEGSTAKEKEMIASEHVPFDRVSVSVVTVMQKGALIAIGTNASLYRPIVSVCQEIGGHVAGVYPLELLKISPDGSDVTKEKLSRLFQEVGGVKAYNFLTDTSVTSSQISGVMGNATFPLWFFAVVGVFLALCVAGGIVFFRYGKETGKKITTITPTHTVIPTPSPTLVPKRDIRITILNGSGIAGQAKKVKDVLVKDGFSEIITDNYDGIYKGGTMLWYSERLSQTLRDEAVATISSIVSNVVAESSPSADVDMMIILGT